MRSMRISSIGLFIVIEMAENPTAKYVKFWFRATLLINFVRASVIVSVGSILAVLQILGKVFGFSVTLVKENVSTEI